ncbi:hypothetical protein RHSIM_Rhsim08G0124600 [Rhododendron simsii]|uniref:Uncharacterized protein n=1 Tax=Rhododendron simsii TaxID=118357 RepID=A0A834GKS3_RHOSS|nr:hypothetical protein RHSIM_Rhsim08G0124600 [Rhododendron simsii]
MGAYGAKYLGLPVFIDRSKRDLFQYIKDRTTKQLRSYKESKINHAGCKGNGGLGLHDLETFNQALLAKQGWKLISGTSSLFRQIFKGRYFPRTSFWHANASSQSSWAWKSIVWVRELIDKGWIWQVQSGKDIRVWEDPWLLKNTDFRINGTTPRREDIKKVVDLIDSDTKSWKVSLIRETFNQDDADAIPSIPISYTSQRDRKIWHPSPNGTFSVKSAYYLAKESSSSHRNLQEGQTSSSSVLPTVWKKLWGLSIHPKRKNQSHMFFFSVTLQSKSGSTLHFS